MKTNEGVGRGKPPLGVNSQAEFEALIVEIDREMAAEGVKIAARPIRAGMKITERYDVQLLACPPRRAPKSDCFDPLEISIRIHDWFESHYGERIKLPYDIGCVAFPLRGAVWVLNCPTTWGRVQFLIDPKTVGQKRPNIGRNSPPKVNILDLIDDFTPALANSITAEEAVKIFIAFITGMEMYSALRVLEGVERIHEAVGDFAAAVAHLDDHRPQYGLSRWASLQAVEKILKAYITEHGGKVKFSHDLQGLFDQAVAFGLPEPPKQTVGDVQCPAGVRYGEVVVMRDEALMAHLLSLELAKVPAHLLAQKLGRAVPYIPEPQIDGVNLQEFLCRQRAI